MTSIIRISKSGALRVNQVKGTIGMQLGFYSVRLGAVRASGWGQSVLCLFCASLLLPAFLHGALPWLYSLEKEFPKIYPGRRRLSSSSNLSGLRIKSCDTGLWARITNHGYAAVGKSSIHSAGRVKFLFLPFRALL
jgi:hypothetical protein